MARNYVKEGDVAEIVVSGAPVVSGQGLLVAGLFGVILNDAAIGETARWQTSGTWELPKADSAAGTFTNQQKIYWDDTAKKITNVSTSNTLIGRAYGAAASTTDGVGNVKLYPVG